MRLLRLLAEFSATPWALDEAKLLALSALLTRSPLDSDLKAFAEAKGPSDGPKAAGAKQNVAVIPIWGVIAHRANQVQDICGPGGTSCEILDAAIQAAIADPSVRSIVLDINSPGGSVFGVQEVADTIAAAREQKPIAAVANATAASAAYWIASAAHEIYVIPSGEVGSIGVFGVHTDDTKANEAAGKTTTVVSAGKYKAEGVGPLTDDARAFMQDRIDGYYSQFVKAVAKNRNVSVDAVRNGYGQGRTLSAGPALAAGMVDGIATLDQVIAKYGRRTAEAANKSRAQDAQISIAAKHLGPTVASAAR